MLNRGAKGQLAEAALSEADLYMSLTRGGDSHTQALLFGGGPALTNSSGVPWTAAYIDSRGEPTADLRSNIAAESRAKGPRYPARQTLGFFSGAEVTVGACRIRSDV